jgi:hypothetical protein
VLIILQRFYGLLNFFGFDWLFMIWSGLSIGKSNMMFLRVVSQVKQELLILPERLGAFSFY